MKTRIAALITALWGLASQAGGIAVSPMVIDKELTAADNTLEFVITNETNAEVTFELTTTPAQHDAKGVPIRGPADYRFDISRAIRLPSRTLKIGPRRWKRVRARVEIPADQRGGYAFIHARALPPQQAGRTEVTAAVAFGVLVELSFPGPRHNGLEVSALRAEAGALRVAVKNTGNVHVKPTGRVELLSLEGNTVWSGRIEPANVFPELVRELKVGGPALSLPAGQYRARIELTAPAQVVAEQRLASADGQLIILAPEPGAASQRAQ